MSPVTRQVVVAPFGVVHVWPPGDAVTVYEVMAEPPLTPGATHETGTWVFW